MKSIKFSFFASLLFLSGAAMTCREECTGPTREIKHSVKRMSVRNLDNRGRKPIPASSDSGVVKTAYGISLSIENEEVIFGPDTAFLPPSCGDLYIPLDTVANVQITTVHALSAAVQAGDDVTGLFRILYPNGEKYGDVQAAIRSHGNGYGFENSVLLRKYTLLLMQAPESAGPQQFRIRLDLTDGRTIEAITEKINLL
jgi:hypothetical protein